MKNRIITLAVALLFVAPAFANDPNPKTPTPNQEVTQVVSVDLVEAKPEVKEAPKPVKEPITYERGRSKLEQAHQPPREKQEEPVVIIHGF